MELSTITQDPHAARRAFIEYRDAFRQEGAAIDGELMRGYRALASGKQLIRLHSTIAAGGVDDLGRPRLAIARADEPSITFSRNSRGGVDFIPTLGTAWAGREVRAADRRFTYPDGTFDDTAWISADTWEAILPIIPPRLRPPHNIEGYHVLWEATWTKPTRRRAPVDPALLKHIGGDLWAVLATWDLTPLEQAVLGMRPSR